MNKNIKTSNENIGLPNEIYNLKPANNLDFEYSYKIDEFNEPQNIIEEIKQLLKNVVYNVKNIGRAFKQDNINLNVEKE